jgi:hypothetical protein
MPGRRVVVAGAVIATAALLVLAAYLGFRRGPLEGPTGPNLSGTSVSVGERATWGAAVLMNTGSKPVELESVELVGDMMDPQVARVEEISVHEVKPYGGDLIGVVRGLGYEHIAAQLRWPVKGTRVPPQKQPGAGVDVLVTVEGLQNGKWRADELVVTYRVGLVKRTLRSPSGFAVCVQPGEEICDIDMADECR